MVLRGVQGAAWDRVISLMKLIALTNPEVGSQTELDAGRP